MWSSFSSLLCFVYYPVSLLQVVLGKVVTRPAVLDEQLAKDIISYQDDKTFLTTLGGTLSTDDFYEGAVYGCEVCCSVDVKGWICNV